MSKKLAEKAGLIQAPPTRNSIDATAGDASARPKTAPGSMLHFMNSQSVAIQESEGLKERLKQFEGARPVRMLDPKEIRASKWANRDEAAFATEEFAQLRNEIAEAGVNVQPIKVRPVVRGVEPFNPPSAAPILFEIVYGHRRHRACLELALPVAALVESVSEQQLFEEMERENRNRTDLSAWEQGQMYARALDSGLYVSNRKLADAIGRDLGVVGKALSLARLPRAVIEAFKTPLDLQYRWAKPLSDAQQANPDLLLTRAREVKQAGVPMTPRQVFERLVGQGVEPFNPPGELPIEVDGKRLATLMPDGRAGAVVRFELGALPERRHAEFVRLMEKFLQKS